MSLLKAEIRDQEGLGCSVGIAPNKLIAKIASGHQKPDGLTVIEPEMVESFLNSLPIRVIPGIGPKSEDFLHERNLRTVDDLRQVPQPTLVEWFGKWGERLYRDRRAASMNLKFPTNGRESRSANKKHSKRIQAVSRSSPGASI